MHRSTSETIKNLEAAFAGESMAHIKYLWFAKLCRAQGDIPTAEMFESTASQEISHAFGHVDLLFDKAKLTPIKCLELAIEGETHEYTEMYPAFRHMAMQEGNTAAVTEIDEQIAESKEHAEQFITLLAKAERRFAALTRVEEQHAKHYQAALDELRT